MSSDDRVMMENPNTGRDDMRIARSMYEPVRQAILEALEDLGEVPFSELATEVEQRTPPELWEDASLKWYTTTVKLDLEAKGQLVKSGSPQVLSMPAVRS